MSNLFEPKKAGGASPMPVAGAVAVFTKELKKIFVFGGRTTGDRVTQDVHSFSTSTLLLLLLLLFVKFVFLFLLLGFLFLFWFLSNETIV
jgi:hypothetical protein